MSHMRGSDTVLCLWSHLAIVFCPHNPDSYPASSFDLSSLHIYLVGPACEYKPYPGSSHHRGHPFRYSVPYQGQSSRPGVVCPWHIMAFGLRDTSTLPCVLTVYSLCTHSVLTLYSCCANSSFSLSSSVILCPGRSCEYNLSHLFLMWSGSAKSVKAFYIESRSSRFAILSTRFTMVSSGISPFLSRSLAVHLHF
jgi:hypothetical protein